MFSDFIEFSLSVKKTLNKIIVKILRTFYFYLESPFQKFYYIYIFLICLSRFVFNVTARFDNDYDVGWNNSSNGNMNDSGSRNSFGGGGGNDGWDNDQSEDGMHCVHMRGLPFKASQSDIADVSLT